MSQKRAPDSTFAFSRMPSSELEPLLEFIKNRLKADGHDVMRSNIYTSPAGNGLLIFSLSKDFVNLWYQVDSLHHYVFLLYFLPQSFHDEVEEGKDLKACFRAL